MTPAERAKIPRVGKRFRLEHGRGFFTIVSYVGLNPDALFDTADACLIRVVDASDRKLVGSVSAVDVLWFENHTPAVDETAKER